jgi:serine/threonine protein kinase
VVSKDGREAFLKALDFHAALTGPGDVLDRIEAFASAYRFERDLMTHCTTRRMSRVIQLLDYGEITVPEAGVISRVPYLIFELADGDIRVFQARLGRFDAAWVLRTMWHTTTGVEQLHLALAAHQDLKPSNVLTQAQGQEMKLGDLGRADRRGVDGPSSEFPIPGAVTYAPPEQLYGAFARTWEERRAGDLYLLGSLGIQLFLGHNMTAMLQAALPKPFRAGTWGGDFDAALPYLVAAHAEVMTKFRTRAADLINLPDVVDQLSVAISDMTAPDPRRRGHPRDRIAKTSSYDVRRYVSLFNRLTLAAEYRLRKA